MGVGTADLSAQNLLIYSVHVACVVAAAASGAMLLRLTPPRARLVFWRAVVLACLLLPLAPARGPKAVAASPDVSARLLNPSADRTVWSAATRSWADALPRLIAWTVVLGAAGRAIWLGAGLAILARIRRRGEIADLGPGVESLRRSLAPRAELKWHPRLTQPVTFGWRRPVVLLPPCVRSLSSATQRAILCHEFLHVNRRDWIWTIAEEIIRTLFWFHPAMRWVLAQVRLGREEIIDATVVSTTGERRSYMDALMSFADEPAILPAASFSHRHQLAVRIRRLARSAQEDPMSRLRLTLAGTALVGAILGSTVGVVRAVPLRRAVAFTRESRRDSMRSPLVQNRAAPTASNLSNDDQTYDQTPLQWIASDLPPHGNQGQSALPSADRVRRVIREVKPEYPPEAQQQGVNASVTLRLTVNAAGDVTQADEAKWTLTLFHGELTGFIQVNGQWEPSGFLGPSGFIEISGENDQLSRFEANGLEGVSAYLASKPWLTLIEAARQAALQWQFEPADRETTCHVVFTFRLKENTGVGDRSVPPGAPVTSWQPVQDATPAALRVGGDIKPPIKIRDVKPVYPPDALAARLQGIVVVETTVGQDGAVVSARILRSIPLLDQAAIDAVRQWVFSPTLLNGKPIPVIVTVTVNFTLE